MGLQFDPVAGEFYWLANKFVKKSGDTMTGTLTLPDVVATGPNMSEFDVGLVIQTGKKLIFDG